MILFHGSNVGGIKILEPRLADHERPYIYLTTIDVVSAFYLCNAVERPYYWFPYGFENSDSEIPVYNELYPNALKEVSENISGYIYKVDADESQTVSFKSISCIRLGVEPLKVSECIEIPDAYALFRDYIRQGKMKLGRYEDKSEKELEWYYNSILGYMKEREMPPDCSYALFVKNKLPLVWERYMKEL